MRQMEPKLTPEPRFIVSPVPASQAREVIARYQHRAIEWIGDWISPLKERRSTLEGVQETDITHFILYREEIATSDKILSNRETWRDFEPIAEWLERFLPTASEQRLAGSLSELKEDILQQLQFSSGTAEYQEKFLETFVETEIVNRALRPELPLILGRKGTGKTAIFRRLLEDNSRKCIVILSPSRLKSERHWVLSAEGFKSIDQHLNSKGKTWREFWLIQICLSCFFSQPGDMPKPDERLILDLDKPPSSELEMTRYIEDLLDNDSVGVLTRDWLIRFDRSAQSTILLLLDGLDTGFGNTLADRERRTKAIEGLLSLITDLADELQNLKLKVLLREDIWRRLRFDNKSHFFGRSVTLAWPDMADFYQVIIKQALQSLTFEEQI